MYRTKIIILKYFFVLRGGDTSVKMIVLKLTYTGIYFLHDSKVNSSFLEIRKFWHTFYNTGQ